MAIAAVIKRTWNQAFPKRQILLRSEGRVVYVSLSSWLQASAALATVLCIGGFTYSIIANQRAVETISGLESRVAAVTAAHDHLASNLAAVHERYSDVAGTMDRSRQQISDLSAQRDTLQKRLKTLTQSLERANLELSRSTSERSSLSRKLAEMQSELRLTEGERGRLANNLDNLASELQRTTEQRDTERQQRQRLSESMVALRHRLEDMQTTRSSLEDAVVERDQMLSHLTEERDGAQRRQQQLAQLVTDLHQQMSAVDAARTELESLLSGQSGQVARLREERDHALSARSVLEQQVASLEGRLTNLRVTQQDVLAQISQHTDAGIKTLEAVVAMTGLKLKPLLDRADTEWNGVGGPLLSLRRSADPAGGEAADADETDRALTHLEQRLVRWSAMHQILAHLPIVAPVNHYRISSSFGRRKDPFTKKGAFHSGVDLAAAKHTRIYSTSPGTVTHVGRRGPYGRMIEIDHGFGLKTRYGHLAKILVNKGDKVGHRQKIGLMGSTGRSTGVHVHYEVLFDGKPVNPMKFLEAGRHVFKQS